MTKVRIVYMTKMGFFWTFCFFPKNNFTYLNTLER
jgi:hypothetical protein